MSGNFFVVARFYLDSGTENLASLPVTHPSWEYEGRVLNWGSIERSISSPIGLPRISDAQIRVADPDRYFRDLLATQTPRRRFIELKILEDGTSEAATDLIYRGEVVNMRFGPGYCEATIRDRTYAWIDELIPNLINRVNFPNLAPEVDEAFFPIVNGECVSSAVDPQGVIALPHIGFDAAIGDRYAAAVTPIEDIIVYRKLPDDGAFSVVNASEYVVTSEVTPFAEVPDLNVTPTFVDFILEQPEGTQIRADIWGINFRGEWNGIPVASTFEENRNPINFFINMIYFIMAKAGQSDTVWDVATIEATLDTFETILSTPSGPSRLLCDGAITRAMTAREWLGSFLPNFQIDFYQQKNGKLAIAYVEDTDPGRFLFTAGHDVEINSFFEDIASPTVNQCRYHFGKNYATGEYSENEIFDNEDDQYALSDPVSSPPVARLEVDDFNFDYVRDPGTALFAVMRHMSFVALGSYRQKWSMDLVETIGNLELARLIGLTHFDGLDAGGYVNKEVKVLGLNIDLDRLKVTVRSILRVPQAIVSPAGGIFPATSYEEYEDPSDVNPVRSHIDNGANAIGADPDACATIFMHAPNSITPNYANLLISGFPDPPSPIVSATIRVTTEYVTGGSADSPLYETRVYNQRNKEMLPAGNATGHISTIDSGLGNSDAAKAEHSVTYTSSEFASYFPGGASDIWLRFGQYDTLSYTCSPDVEYRVYGRPTIEYVYA